MNRAPHSSHTLNLFTTTRLTLRAYRTISTRYVPFVYEMYMDMTGVCLTGGQYTVTPSLGALKRSILVNPLEYLLGNIGVGDRRHFLREMSPDRGRNGEEGRNIWVNLHRRTFLTVGIIRD